MAIITAFANQKGGTGKTTALINLAVTLSKSGKKVLIVDLDPLGGATTGLGINRLGKTSSYDLMLGGKSADYCTSATCVEGLFIIPSVIDLAGGEVELAFCENREKLLKKALKGASTFDHIFIDCPPSLGLLTLNALVASDGVVIPITSEYYSFEGAVSILRTVDIIKSSLNPSIKTVGVLLGKQQGKSLIVRQITEEITEFFKDKVFETVIPASVRIAECPSYGLPVVLRDEFCRASVAFENLKEEFLKRVETP